MFYRNLQKDVAEKGLQVAPEKIQAQDPYNYLGFRITDQTVSLQKVVIRRQLKDFE